MTPLAILGASYAAPAFLAFVALRHVGLDEGDTALYNREDAITALQWPLFAGLAVYLITIGRNAGDS